MKTLTPVVGSTLPNAVTPEDGVDMETALSVEAATQSLANRDAYLNARIEGTPPATATQAGLHGVGASSSGIGVEGTGGATNGHGVKGTGNGSGTGVWGAGGTTNGLGVRGDGVGAGAGVQGTGGSTGIGLVGVPGAGGDGGVKGTAGSLGTYGVFGTMGAAAATGVSGYGVPGVVGFGDPTNNGRGGDFTGGGTGEGVRAVGGANGPGLQVAAGAGNARGAIVITGQATGVGTHPASAAIGTLYYNSSDDTLWFRRSGGWIALH